MHWSTFLVAGLPAALATVARRQSSSSAIATTTSIAWSDECLVAEESFVAELEAIETSSVAPALQSYLATVVSTGITNYCEPTNAPAIVSAEWRDEVVSIDAIIVSWLHSCPSDANMLTIQNVYSADISQVKSCLASYQTAAGTPYALAPAASAIFSTISSLEACTYTPSATAVANITSTLSPSGNSTPTLVNRTTTTSQSSVSTPTSVVTAGGSSEGLRVSGWLALAFSMFMLSVAML